MRTSFYLVIVLKYNHNLYHPIGEEILEKKSNYDDDSIDSEMTMNWFDKLIKTDYETESTEDLAAAVKMGKPMRTI